MKKQLSVMSIAFILSYICVASIAAAMVTPAMPEMAAYFHVSMHAIGSIVSVFLLGYVFGQLIYGPLANRIGINAALQAGLFIGLLGVGISLFAGYFNLYTVCLLGRFICAMGTASGLSCTFMILHAQLTEKQVKQASAYSVIAFTAGIGLAVLCGGIITQYLGWLACFWLLLIYILAVFVFSFFLPRCAKAEMQEGFLQNIAGLVACLKQVNLWLFALVVGLCSTVGYVYSAAAPLIAQHQLNLTAAAYGYWNSINMIGMLLSGFTGAYLLKRFSAQTVIVISIIAILATLIVLTGLNYLHAVTVLPFFIVTSLLYLFGGWCFPAGATLAMQVATNKAHAASAKSFINMGSATLAVFIYNWLPGTRLDMFILVIAVFAIMITIGLILSKVRA